MAMAKAKDPGLSVIWEVVPDSDSNEKLRKVFEILLRDDGKASGSGPCLFDERPSAGQDESGVSRLPNPK
jgi:hypothetical protein